MTCNVQKFKANREAAQYLLVDVQTQLFSVMSEEDRKTVEKNTSILVAGMKELGVPVVVTEQYTKGLGVTIESLKVGLGDLYQPIEKLAFSCWGEPPIREKLQSLGKKQVVISGIETHVCILQTVLDLIANGYEVHVVADAICSRFRSDREYALRMMEKMGAVITTTEIVLFQMLEVAGGPQFKAVSRLVKDR